MRRVFCRECGVNLWTQPSLFEGKAFVKVSRFSCQPTAIACGMQTGSRS